MTDMSASISSKTSADAQKPAVSLAFMFAYLFAIFTICTSFLSPLLVTLAIKLGQISADGQRAADLGAILAPGAFAALLAAPIFGALSDRTPARFGRRKFWMGVGIFVMFMGLISLSNAKTLIALKLGWLVVQIGANASLAGVNAILPDLVPERQRGQVSALIGIAVALALLAGPYYIQFTRHNSQLMFLAPWVLSPFALGLLCLTFKDNDAPVAPKFGLADLARTFWVNPVKHQDFGWAFLSRFLVYMGVAYFITFQFIFINDHFKLNEGDAIKALIVSQLLNTAVTITFTLLSGWLSDRMGQRKPIILFAGLLVAVGLLTIATSSSLLQFYIGSAIFGVGQGVYFAVDMALVAAVLPNTEDTAKDMGVFNIASTLPQTIAPVMAPLFLGIGAIAGGNLPAVFIAGAAFAVVGAFVVLPIKKAK